jgi:hypothetical protein
MAEATDIAAALLPGTGTYFGVNPSRSRDS